MNIPLNEKELQRIASKKGKKAKCLYLELLLVGKGLYPINKDNIAEGIEDGEHYCKDILNTIEEFAKAGSEIMQETTRDMDELIKESEARNSMDYKPDMSWEASDTDLLELVTSLYEGGYINNKNENLTRKDAFKYFEFIFNHPVKDAESKLSKAISIRKDATPFLDSLTKAYLHYRDEKAK